jgi:hypothetical protein
MGEVYTVSLGNLNGRDHLLDIVIDGKIKLK